MHGPSSVCGQWATIIYMASCSITKGAGASIWCDNRAGLGRWTIAMNDKLPAISYSRSYLEW